MTHTSTEQPEALKLAHEIGANRIKVQPTEQERQRFEQWMAGHCWQVGGVWDGKTYVSTAENGDYLDPQAMHTRQLFAAWRDCAALRDQLEASQAQRVPLGVATIAEIAESFEATDPTDSFWVELCRAFERASVVSITQEKHQ